MTADVPTETITERPSEFPMRRHRWLAWWLRPKVAIPAFLLLLLLASPLLLRGYKLSQVPVAPELFDTQAVLSVVIPDEQNAFVEFRKAGQLLVKLPSSEAENLGNASGSDWADVAPSVRQWVADNKPALELWNKGAEKIDSQLLLPTELTADTRVPFLQIRDIARIASMDAARLRAEGHPDRAWQQLRTGLRTSHHIGRRGPMIECLLGLTFHDVMSEAIVRWSQDPCVTSELLAQAQKDLPEALRGCRTLDSTLRMEYLAVLETLASPSLVDQLPDSSFYLRGRGMDGLWLYAMGEPELCRRCASHAFSNYLSQATKPRRERARQSGRHGCFEPEIVVVAKEPTVAQLDDWIDQSIASGTVMLGDLLIPSLFDGVDRTEARGALLKTVLALELYKRQRGRYPESLEQLVPTFMTEVPDDLFAPVPTPLKYHSDGTRATIWSISQNEVDDGGNVEAGIDTGYVLGPKKAEPDRSEE